MNQHTEREIYHSNVPPGATSMKAVYILYLIGVFLSAGLLTLLGVLIAFINKDTYRQTSLMMDHYRYAIRSFWYSILWTILGVVLVFTVIGALLGWLLMLFSWVWFVYRSIKGLCYLLDGRRLYF